MINTINEDIRAFIIRELGLERLSPEEQDTVVSRFGESLSQKVAIELLEKLPEDKRDSYARIVEGGDQQALAEFLKANISDADKVVGEVLRGGIEEFKDMRDGLKS